MYERLRNIALVAGLTVGTLLSRDVMPVMAGGCPDTASNCPGATHQLLKRIGTSDYDLELWGPSTPPNRTAEYDLLIASKTRFLGFLWITDDGKQEALRMIISRCGEKDLGIFYGQGPEEYTLDNASCLDSVQGN